MPKHFNGLTPAEAERLAMLSEECGEVIQIIGKILRHGYDSYHPDDPGVTNRDLLGKELIDLAAVESKMLVLGDIPSRLHGCLGRTWLRKLRFTHHQENTDDR